MKRGIIFAAALVAVVLIGSVAHAQAWERYTSKELGVSLLIPRGARPAPKEWPDQWKGVHADYKGVKLFVIARPGKKHTASYMEDLGLRTSGVDAKIWTGFKTVEKKDGWVWYNRASVADGKQAAFTVYGIANRGSFVTVLVTTADDARKRKAAFEAWLRSVQVR